MTTQEASTSPTEWSGIVDPSLYQQGVPHDLMKRMRHSGPVVWVDEPAVDHLPAGSGFWAVLGHAEVGTVLRDPKTFSSSLGLTQLYDAPPPLLAHYRSMMINMDPPEHSRLRRLVARSFTPAAVRHLEAAIEERCAQLVGAVTPNAPRGECDFARDVVAELPLQTLADLLGMPESDRWLMFDWANRVIGMLDAEYGSSSLFDAADASPMARAAMAARPVPGPDGTMPDARHPAGMADLYVYARHLAEHLRRNPGPDVMSQILRVSDEGGVSPQEFENLFWLFCVAGNETVRNALPGGVYGLLAHEQARRELWSDPSLLNNAVEEMLRWWTAVVHFRRTTTVDVRLGGASIRAGDKVVVFFSAANRDPEVFADPDRFDIHRQPNPQLAFGGGPHYCIGASLSRTQIRVMMRTVMARWSDVWLAAEPIRLRASFQNGIKRLPVEFTVRGHQTDERGPSESEGAPA